MHSGHFTTADGTRLAYEVAGTGLPVLWQHGLCADRAQPAEVFPDRAGRSRITMECRGHGLSELGDPSRIGIRQFADDAIALLDHLGIARAVVGGISLGAAIAMHIAARHPARTSALILARPAWLAAPAPPRLRVYAEVAARLAAHDAHTARGFIDAMPVMAEIAAVSPDNIASLHAMLERPDPVSTIALLSRIPLDGPGLALTDIRAIAAKTLVIGTQQDWMHPFEYARTLAAEIPDARLAQITSKTVSRPAHVAGFRDAMDSFLAGCGVRP